MVDWLDTLSAPVEAIEHGIDATEWEFRHESTGPLSFAEIDYPAAQVLPEELARTNATDYQHSVLANLYFEFDRSTKFVDDILHPVDGVLDESLAALDSVNCITDYHPNRIEFFAGQPNNSLLLAVSIRFFATTLVDPAAFSP